MSKTPLQPHDKYVLRLPEGMRARIKEAAARANRSMNSEIIARLSGGQLNLRDYFAGQALAGLIASGHSAYDMADCDDQALYAAYRAYTVADAMLTGREAKS